MPNQRVMAFSEAVGHMRDGVWVHWHRDLIEQDPETPGFREMWASILTCTYDLEPGDYLVSSEPYGQWLAEMTGAQFFPYDPYRQINDVRGTWVRDMPYMMFGSIIPEFRPCLRTRVTIFGAESCGKTTLSQDLARRYGCHWLFEWARPYLEVTGNDVTEESMLAIWKGQAALQRHGITLGDRPLLLQDTDLFSTVGYWQLYRETLGQVPDNLIRDAEELKSDLYVIAPSNIPFEPDPLRYGGNVRETPDQYWVNVCDRFGLNYVVLEHSDPVLRMVEADRLIDPVVRENLGKIGYDRKGF